LSKQKCPPREVKNTEGNEHTSLCRQQH
jgi:hypothetical protein